jgi:hypothetical protein
MSECLNNSTVVGCFNDGTNPPQSVVIHYTYDNLGAPAVRITDSSGAVVAGATVANTTPGACPVASPDVEFAQLCDLQGDGTVIEFIRRTVTTFDAAGVPTTVTADLELDHNTAYAPTGTVVACGDCPPLAARGLQAAW